MNYVPLFYTHGWLVGMIFAEVLERCVKANKPLTGANMKRRAGVRSTTGTPAASPACWCR